MLKIKNDTSTLLVTVGAFKEIYKKQGYEICVPEAPQEESANTDNKISTEERTSPSQDEFDSKKTESVDESSEEETLEEDFNSEDFEDLSEKPLADMSFSELKEYATQLNIGFEGLKKNELKDKIKSSL